MQHFLTIHPSRLSCSAPLLSTVSRGETFQREKFMGFIIGRKKDTWKAQAPRECSGHPVESVGKFGRNHLGMHIARVSYQSSPVWELQRTVPGFSYISRMRIKSHGRHLNTISKAIRFLVFKLPNVHFWFKLKVWSHTGPSKYPQIMWKEEFINSENTVPIWKCTGE